MSLNDNNNINSKTSNSYKLVKFEKFAKFFFVICSILLLLTMFYLIIIVKNVIVAKDNINNNNISDNKYSISAVKNIATIGKIKSWQISGNFLVIELQNANQQQFTVIDLKQNLPVTNWILSTEKNHSFL